MTEREYNQCVTEYADNVYRFILKNLRHEEDAKDVVQTAFEKMWRNRNEVEYEKSKSYLFTIAYHQMIDHIRKVKRIYLKEEFKEEVRIHDKPMHNVKKILEEALARLNETQRSLVMLKDYEGYSYEEIGKITGLNESQVKVYLHRARVQLKEWLVKTEDWAADSVIRRHLSGLVTARCTDEVVPAGLKRSLCGITWELCRQ